VKHALAVFGGVALTVAAMFGIIIGMVMGILWLIDQYGLAVTTGALIVSVCVVVTARILIVEWLEETPSD